jgi:hypothetical protein
MGHLTNDIYSLMRLHGPFVANKLILKGTKGSDAVAR